MRVTAGILGVLASAAVLWIAMMACVAAGLLMGLPSASPTQPNAPAEVFRFATIWMASGAVALASSVVVLARRKPPRAVPVVLVLAGAVVMATEGWVGVFLIVAGLLGIGGDLVSRRRSRPSIQTV